MVCEKLKTIYYPHKPWIECYKDVATKFTALKKVIRKYYPDQPDVEVVRNLNKYSVEDIKEAIE